MNSGKEKKIQTNFIFCVKQLAGFSQHDSHEILPIMLDALHMKSKPYQD